MDPHPELTSWPAVMSLVRDIFERPTGAAASSAGNNGDNSSPVIPAPPSSSSTSSGFPVVPHRSQRVSAFKRQRQRAEEAQARGVVGAAGQSGTTEGTGTSAGPSRLTPYRPQQRSDGSSPADGPAKFSSSSFQPSDQIPSSIDAEHAQSAMGTNESEILRSAAVENAERVSRMSDTERRREQQELEEMFGAGLMEKLRRRAERKKTLQEDLQDQDQQHESVAKQDPHAQPLEQLAAKADSPRRVRFDPEPKSQQPPAVSSPSNDGDPLDPEAIRRNYFPEETPRPAVLEWMMPQDTVQSPTSASRFDLSGEHIPSAVAASLPSHHGLHHHGADSDAAGYTIDEILTLANSSYVPQRRLMLGVLGKIVGRQSRQSAYEASLTKELEDAKLLETAFKLSTGVLCSNERNLGVLTEAIACWTACLHAVRVTTSPPAAWITSMPIDALLDRQGPTLATPLSQAALQPSSICQLLDGLLVLSEVDSTLADAIASILPGVTSAYILASSWPAVGGPHDAAVTELVLRLIVAVTSASRASAKLLMQSGVYDALLRFLAIEQVDQSDEVWETIALVLRAYDGVARYGLNGQILPTVINVLPALGARIASRVPQGAALRTGAAYFAFLRTWIVCATDPHAMELEHDLIWTQIEGLGWASEAADALRQVWPEIQAGVNGNDDSVDLNGFANSCLDVLAAWIRGVSINEIRQGEDEKRKVEGLLRELGEPPSALQTPCRRIRKALSGDAQGSPTLQASDLPSAVDQISQYCQGQETAAMDLVDRLLDAEIPDAQDVGHRHGVYVLRPFLHYAILPNLDVVVGPDQPESKLLKVATTLRASGIKLVDRTWLYSPIDALLNRKVTDVWKQLPPAWDATDVELVRATLIFARQAGAIASLATGDLLMAAMKVYMLETQGAKEIFRDAVVQRELQALIRPSLERTSNPNDPTFPILGALPEATTLHQFFVELLDLYEGVSYGDHTFGQILYPLLAQRYPADYRIALWSEHTEALRTMRHSHDQIPAETGSLQEYLEPVETNQQVLLAYAGHLQRMTAKSHPFLHSLATHHVSKAVMRDDLPPAVVTQLKRALNQSKMATPAPTRPLTTEAGQQSEVVEQSTSASDGKSTPTSTPSFIAPSPLELGETGPRKIPLIGGAGPQVDDHDHALVNPMRHQPDAELGFWDRSKKRAKEDRASLDYSEFRR